MPKPGQSDASKLRGYVREFGNVFQTDGRKLLCTYCEVSISFDKRSQVTQHISAGKHIRAVHAVEKSKAKKQQLITVCAENISHRAPNVYFSELCNFMVGNNIPFKKLNNASFKTFFEAYTSRACPDESTLRKTYLAQTYNQVMAKIRKEIGENFIWVSIDETTDAEGRYMASVVVGTLPKEGPGKTFLLTIEELSKTNGETIARLFNDSMSLIWPEKVDHDKVLAFISDAAPYMKKAGKAIKMFYPKAVHMTCLVHGLHRVAESIRTAYDDVNSLISNGKAAFLKAPSRVLKLREMFSDLALPPSPVITRWGTWLEAAIYYATNYEKIKAVVNTLDPEESGAVRKLCTLWSDRLKSQLTFISSNYSDLLEAITSLEKRDLQLSQSIGIVKKLQNKWSEVSETLAIKKLNSVLENNPGWEKINSINEVLSGEVRAIEPYTPEEAACLRFCPLTSVDVERSFSVYKTILADNRRSLTVENIKHVLVANIFLSSYEI